MRKVLLAAGLAIAVWSCGDDRSETAGAGNTDTASTNTTIGTGNGGHTLGADTIGMQPGNPSGYGNDSGNRNNMGADTSRTRSGNQ
ncbi:MAG TPA: hypothetical protein VGB71_13125 [Flavisolibacter sp.]|jgi:hypothetical protein